MKYFVGKSVEEALEKASEELNSPIEDITYEVVSETKSMLGLKKKVQIAAYTEAMVIEFVQNYLIDVIQALGLEVELSTKYEDGFIRIKISTNHNSILIGKNGRTLQALNQIVRCVANFVFKKRIRILLDINDYKEEKYAKLVALAKREAIKVSKTKITAVLDPMTADERRAIHNAIANFKNVKTVSEGEGKNRHITIVYEEN